MEAFTSQHPPRRPDMPSKSAGRPDESGWGNSMSFIGRDMAVDLGTANTLVYVRGSRDRTERAVRRGDQHPIRVGSSRSVPKQKKMIGRTPGNIVAVRPLKDGVIADFEITERMLRYFILKIHKRRYLARPRVVVCVPSRHHRRQGTDAVIEASSQAGADRCTSSRSPWPPPSAPVCRSTRPRATWWWTSAAAPREVAVISLGGIVTAQSIRVAGDERDNAIIQYIKKEYSLLLGERTAEQIKITIGSAYDLDTDEHTEVARPGPGVRAAQDRRHLGGRGPQGHPGAGQRDRGRGEGHPRQVPAGAVRRHHGPRNRSDRRRSPAARARRVAAAGRPACRSTSPRTRWMASRSAPGSASRFEALQRVLDAQPRR